MAIENLGQPADIGGADEAEPRGSGLGRRLLSITGDLIEDATHVPPAAQLPNNLPPEIRAIRRVRHVVRELGDLLADIATAVAPLPVITLLLAIAAVPVLLGTLAVEVALAGQGLSPATPLHAVENGYGTLSIITLVTGPWVAKMILRWWSACRDKPTHANGGLS
jgi:hypothetical protein